MKKRDRPSEASSEEPAEDAASEGSRTPGPTVVGIGASAGGLAALRQFFAHVPEESGLAFVVVVHLSPEHESHLAELLQPHVKMNVQQVTQTTPLEADHVYVIPPNANLSAIDTHLRLSPMEEQRRKRAPIDHFFGTLSETHNGEAVGVILSGTGSDGTLGLQRIKERGGLAAVQSPEEAEYDGMPRSAIATGVVDLVLPVAEIPRRILSFDRAAPAVPVPGDGERLQGEDGRLLQRVLAQLRACTGHDFSRYKPSTVTRRLRRRMQLRSTDGFAAYLDLLREDGAEANALVDDLLITVTSFFRDSESFEMLGETVVPKLFEGKGPDESVRVWSVGCATGEEAYSLAMLLLEEATRRAARREGPPPEIQVFASDLHERSLKHAREGLYSETIEAEVSPERLARFFQQKDGGYRVCKEVRDRVVFARHNLLKDPPFSRLDLIACRNVLIYLQRDVQEEVVSLFHYALNAGGFLLLGTAETLSRLECFRPESKEHHLYRSRNVQPAEVHLPVFPLTPMPMLGAEEHPARRAKGAPSRGALHQKMVEQYAPPSVLVNEDYNVIHLSERAGRYLALPGGELTTSLFKLAQESLQIELRAAFYAAKERGQPARSQPVPVDVEGETRRVVLRVRPAEDPELQGYFLVLFDEVEEEPWAEGEPPGEGMEAAGAATPRALEAELEATKKQLRAVAEEHETSREEMRASYEELQSANEELRSTMEELETSKEELQSINEELQTVNQENKHKVEELSQLSDDLQNLFTATDIATLFLNRDLRILRFTPRVSDLFSVRHTDRGRPLADLTHRLGYDALQEDARRVLDQLVPVEREARAEDGRWYLVRLLPYRTAADHIAGVVITFIDITALKRSEASLRTTKEYAERIVDTVRGGMLVLDEGLRVRSASRSFYEAFEVNPEDTVGRLVYALGNGQWDIPALRKLLEDILPENDAFDDFLVEHDFEHIGPRKMLLNARRLEEHQLILLAIEDITERKAAEEALRQSEVRFRRMAETVPDILFTATAAGRIDYVNYRMEEVTGRPPEAIHGTALWPELIHPDDQERTEAAWDEAQEAFAPFEVRHRLRISGGTLEDSYRWFITRARPIRNGGGTGGAVVKWFGTATDIDTLVRAEEALRQLTETLEERVEARTGQVRRLASRLTMAEQEERRRISQVLHDDLQQQLYGVQMKLSFTRREALAGRLEASLENLAGAEAWLDQSIAITRQLTVDLSPPVLKSEGLADMLEWLVAQMREKHGLEVELVAGQAFRLPDEDLRVLLFQAVRELLFNVVKHAGVERARLELREAGSGLVVHVSDEGHGFDAEAAARRAEHEGGFGLFSVRERISLLGGQVEVASAPGEGTRVTVYVPASAVEAPPQEPPAGE